MDYTLTGKKLNNIIERHLEREYPIRFASAVLGYKDNKVFNNHFSVSDLYKEKAKLLEQLKNVIYDDNIIIYASQELSDIKSRLQEIESKIEKLER